jgi:hypothetical protein
MPVAPPWLESEISLAGSYIGCEGTFHVELEATG